MNSARSFAITGWSAAPGMHRRAVARALAVSAAGVLIFPPRDPAVVAAAAKRTRDHPAIVALTAVLDDAADRFSVPVKDIAVQRMEARDWPDSCLGTAAADEGCAEVITPGFHIVLDTPGGEMSYRTDQRGNFREEPAAAVATAQHIHFARTGGIAGRHDELDLDTADLPDDVTDELRRLIEDAAFWDLPEEIDEGSSVTDGYTYEVTVGDGSRNHTVAIYGIASLPHSEHVGFWRLVSWLDERLSAS